MTMDGDQAQEREMSGREVPVARIRRAVARAMTQSAAVPQFAIDRDIRMSGLLKFRRCHRDGASISDLMHAAIARALIKHPRLNASWRDDRLIEYDHVNLGLALAVPDGLLVPAINRAERLSLAELKRQRLALADAAAQGTLHPRQLGTATFTVSNIGPSRATGIRPMVIPPQAAILGIPYPHEDGPVTVTITCDHRVVDGYPAAEFLATLAECIEHPDWMESITE